MMDHPIEDKLDNGYQVIGY